MNLSESLVALANAVRSQAGTTDKLTIADMIDLLTPKYFDLIKKGSLKFADGQDQGQGKLRLEAGKHTISATAVQHWAQALGMNQNHDVALSVHLYGNKYTRMTWSYGQTGGSAILSAEQVSTFTVRLPKGTFTRGSQFSLTFNFVTPILLDVNQSYVGIEPALGGVIRPALIDFVKRPLMLGGAA
jgi:hypothetical protein